MQNHLDFRGYLVPESQLLSFQGQKDGLKRIQTMFNT